MEELRYHAANYKDADRSSEALYLFGYGDGGGGADAGMIERLRRSADLQGAFLARRSAIPKPPSTGWPPLRLTSRSSRASFISSTTAGIDTSQAEVKRLKRLCETRLQALEFLAVASRLAGCAAPTASQIEALWRRAPSPWHCGRFRSRLYV